MSKGLSKHFADCPTSMRKDRLRCAAVKFISVLFSVASGTFPSGNRFQFQLFDLQGFAGHERAAGKCRMIRSVSCEAEQRLTWLRWSAASNCIKQPIIRRKLLANHLHYSRVPWHNMGYSNAIGPRVTQIGASSRGMGRLWPAVFRPGRGTIAAQPHRVVHSQHGSSRVLPRYNGRRAAGKLRPARQQCEFPWPQTTYGHIS